MPLFLHGIFQPYRAQPDAGKRRHGLDVPKFGSS
jgi:hypothetical protein